MLLLCRSVIFSEGGADKPSMLDKYISKSPELSQNSGDFDTVKQGLLNKGCPFNGELFGAFFHLAHGEL